MISRLGLAFSLLPGWWWGFEADRWLSPPLTIEAWNDLLRNIESTGTDLVPKDYEDEQCHQINIITSTAKELSGDPPIMPETHLL